MINKNGDLVKFYIIFVGGDESVITILKYFPHHEYDLHEYKIASRHVFDEEVDAIDYAKELVKKSFYRIRFEHNHPETYYLD